MRKAPPVNDICIVPLTSTKGFVLPVVLVLMAIMTIASFAVVSILDRHRQQVLLQKNQWQAQQELRATSAIIKYLLASHPINRVGLAVDVPHATPQYIDAQASGREILLDGRWYAGVGKTRFRIQDQAGLVALNFIDDPMLDKYLQSYQVAPLLRKQLVASLWDYIDPDDQRRLHGAEKQDYLRAKLPPPPNRLMQLPHELAKVKGWQDSHLLTPDFLDKLTVFKGGDWVNVNTSPVEVLSLHPDLTVQLSQQIVAGRPWSSIKNINDALGVNFELGNGSQFLIYPGIALRIQVLHPELSRGREYFLRLVNGHALSRYLGVGEDSAEQIEKLHLQPWKIIYVLDYPLDRESALPAVQETGLDLFSSTPLAPAP